MLSHHTSYIERFHIRSLFFYLGVPPKARLFSTDIACDVSNLLTSAFAVGLSVPSPQVAKSFVQTHRCASLAPLFSATFTGFPLPLGSAALIAKNPSPSH